MLISTQIKEIKEHLDKAQNPIFFFDNDPDGLCSFLILQRYCEKGKGVPIKSFPELTADYFRKIHELNADYIFILDKPLVSEVFLKEAEQINIPVVWIDHHEIDKSTIPKFVNYFNPIFNKNSTEEPVTILCNQIAQREEDLWIAIVGGISDKFIPDEYSDFMKKFPELGIETKNAFDIFYKSEIGKIARIFSFALKDRTTNVINMLRFLIKVKSPYDVLEENSQNYTMHQRFEQIEKRHKKLMEKATEIVKDEDKIIYFQYGGDMSISSDLSNELNYLYPKKIVVVIYISGVKGNISARGKNVKKLIIKSIEGLEGATGGGHDDAVGAQVKIEDLEKFREKLMELVEK